MEEADASLLGYKTKYNFTMNSAATPSLSPFRIVCIEYFSTFQSQIQMIVNSEIWWAFLLVRYVGAELVKQLVNNFQKGLLKMIHWSLE